MIHCTDMKKGEIYYCDECGLEFQILNECQGCGTCTGECPANAIQLVNYTDEQIMLSDIGGLGSWLPAASVKQ